MVIGDMHLTHEIQHLVVSLDISLSHIPWSQKAMDDKIAKWGVGWLTLSMPM